MSDNQSNSSSMNRAVAAAQLAKDKSNKEMSVHINTAIMSEKAQALSELHEQKQPRPTEFPSIVPESVTAQPQAEQADPAPQEPVAPAPRPQSVYLNKGAAFQKNGEQKSPNIITGLGDEVPESKADSKITTVDLSIMGTTHRITCPASEAMQLNRSADQINNALKQLRLDLRGRSTNNENLLVLHCLELYDKIRELTAEREQDHNENERAIALIDKILKDAGKVSGV